MWHCLATIEPLDPVSGERQPLHASSADLASICALDGKVWEPAIATPPQLAIRLFNGDLETAIEPGAARLPLAMGVLKETYPDADRYDWSGAPLSIYAGKEDEPWPWRLVFRGNVREFAREARLVNLRGEVDTAPFEADLLTAYEGTGGAAGGPDLKGKLKPLIFGHAMNVEPVLLDAIDNVYQFSGYGPIEAVSALFERGSNFGSAVADYADFAALVAATIEPGDWATCLAEGLVRLGAPAHGVITGDVRGHKVGASTPRLTGAIITAAAQMAGVDPALIDAGTVSALDADKPFPVNVVITEQTKFLDLARRLARPCNHQAGVSLTGQFFVTKVDFAPAAVLALDGQGASLPEVKEVTEGTTSPPYAKFTLGANRCWRVQTPDEIAFQAEIVDRGLYEAGATYREGNIVTSPDRSRWIYTNAAPSSGNAPPAWPVTSNAYWANIEPPPTAGDLTYEDGTPIEALKPAEPGATEGAPPGTPVGDRPAEQVTGELDQHTAQIAAAESSIVEAQGDIQSLFDIYGDTESAAQSAADALASKNAAQAAEQLAGQHEANAGLAKQNALDAQAAAEAAEAGATDQAGVATQQRQLAETARAGAESFRNDAFTARDTAEGAAATATAQAGLSASSATTAQQIVNESFRKDFNKGGDYWVSGQGYAVGNLPSAPSITANPDVTVETVTGIGKVLQGAGQYRVMSERATRPFVTGERRRFRIRTRLTVDPSAGQHRHYAWMVYTNADGSYAGYNALAMWTGLTVADGWITREVDFDPLERRSIGGNGDISQATAWRLMLGINGFPIDTVAGAVQQIQWIECGEVTSEVAAQGFANASSESAATAATKATEADQSATVAVTAKNDAETARSQAQGFRNEAVSARDDAAGSASSAATSEAIVSESQKKANASLADTFPKAFDPSMFGLGNSGPAFAIPPLDDTAPSWIDPGRTSITVPVGQYSFNHRGIFKSGVGRRYRLVADVEVINAGGQSGVYVGFYGRGLDASYNLVTSIGWNGSPSASATIAQGQRQILSYELTLGASYDTWAWLRLTLLVNRLPNSTTGNDSAVTRVHALYVEDITESSNAAGSASAAASSEATASTAASEATGAAATATQQAGISVAAKNDAQTSAGTAQGHAASASADAASAAASESQAANYKSAVERIERMTWRSDYNEGAGAWLSSYSYTKAALADAADPTVFADVTLVSVAGIGKVLQANGIYRPISSRMPRPVVAGQKWRIRVRTRLTQNRASGTESQYLWLTTHDANGDYSGYGSVAVWTGLTVANGWVTREFTFDPSVEVTALSNAGSGLPPVEWRLMLGLNGYNADGAAGQIQQIAWVTLEDVTSLEDASTQAGIATTAASEASADAASAEADRVLTSQYRGQAETAATSSEGSATVAAAEAAAAKRWQELAAGAGGGTFNRDPGFDSWPDGAVLPDLWNPSGLGSSNTTRVSDGRGGYAPRVSIAAATGCFFSQVYQDTQAFRFGTWVVLEGEVILHSGSLRGAGVMLRLQVNANGSGTIVDDLLLNFAGHKDITGSVPADGVAGRTYVYRKLVQVDSQQSLTANSATLYALINNSNMGTLAAKDITFLRAGCRFATEAEISAQTALPALEATVSSQGQVLQDLDTSFASLENTVQAQGATVTQHSSAIAQTQGDVTTLFGKVGVTIDIDGYQVGWEQNNDGDFGSTKFRTDYFEVSSPGGGPSLTWTKDANNRPTLKVDDGAGSTVEIGWCP